ncbi:MAG: sigma-70 family RNA polymerase sigma factor [Deltaproteobacteria bacterium]|nr:sigma-70 family RNA polymerase sigma factor [Deltaproteobacteria bacterium]
MGPSDAELAARVVAADDRHAFAQLVRRHQSAVRSLLRRLCSGDAALADDLAQETFVRVWKGLRSWRGGARFSTWMHRIAVNVWLSQARRSAPPVPDIAEAAPGRAGAVEARRDLERAFAFLRPEERMALALAYAQDLTHEEAAEAAGWPLGTLKSHLLRGKEKLRQRLAPEEGAA